MSELVERVDAQDRVLGVVERGEAIRQGWLHRVAATICRDPEGRVLVYRRPEGISRFPGHHDVFFGGAVGVGESYQEAAARELEEELGVRADTRLLFTYLCDGEISPYWLGVHEALISGDTGDTGDIDPDPAEVAWFGWMSESELEAAVRRWPFIPDGQEAFARYSGLVRASGGWGRRPAP
jgi:8-oxo-dGTP pyrophosphatase MutT (NUDIX family)